MFDQLFTDRGQLKFRRLHALQLAGGALVITGTFLTSEYESRRLARQSAKSPVPPRTGSAAGHSLNHPVKRFAYFAPIVNGFPFSPTSKIRSFGASVLFRFHRERWTCIGGS